MIAASARADHAVMVCTADSVVGFGGLAPKPMRNVRLVELLGGGSAACVDWVQLSSGSTATIEQSGAPGRRRIMTGTPRRMAATDMRNMTARGQAQFRRARCPRPLSYPGMEHGCEVSH